MCFKQLVFYSNHQTTIVLQDSDIGKMPDFMPAFFDFTHWAKMVDIVASQVKENKKNLWNHDFSAGICLLMQSTKTQSLLLGGENKNTNWAHWCFEVHHMLFWEA